MVHLVKCVLKATIAVVMESGHQATWNARAMLITMALTVVIIATRQARVLVMAHAQMRENAFALPVLFGFLLF